MTDRPSTAPVATGRPEWAQGLTRGRRTPPNPSAEQPTQRPPTHIKAETDAIYLRTDLAPGATTTVHEGQRIPVQWTELEVRPVVYTEAGPQPATPWPQVVSDG